MKVIMKEQRRGNFTKSVSPLQIFPCPRQKQKRMRAYHSVSGGRIFQNPKGEHFLVTTAKVDIKMLQPEARTNLSQTSVYFRLLGKGPSEIYNFAKADLVVFPKEFVDISIIKLRRDLRNPDGTPNKQWKGRGLFPVVLEEAKKLARRRKMHQLRLTAETDALVKYYSQFGFVFQKGARQGFLRI